MTEGANMNKLNQLMMAERSVFADMGGGGELAQDLGKIIERAQQAAYRSVDVMLVYRNWFLGKRIAEEELNGAIRAEYGKEAMMKLAAQLTAKYGPGFDFGSLYKYLAFLSDLRFWTHCVQNLGCGSVGRIARRFVEQHEK